MPTLAEEFPDAHAKAQLATALTTAYLKRDDQALASLIHAEGPLCIIALLEFYLEGVVPAFLDSEHMDVDLREWWEHLCQTVAMIVEEDKP